MNSTGFHDHSAASLRSVRWISKPFFEGVKSGTVLLLLAFCSCIQSVCAQTISGTNTLAGGTLTLNAGIITPSGVINGGGILYGNGFTNNGTIVADTFYSFVLSNSSLVNNNFIGATNGATLDLGGSSVNQGNKGVIVASGTNFFYATSKIQLESTAITGGTILSSNSGSFVINSGTNSFTNLTNSAAVNVVFFGNASPALNLSNVVNATNGSITNGGILNVSASTNMGLIYNYGGNFDTTNFLNAAAGVINGGGTLYGNGFTNNGTIVADTFYSFVLSNSSLVNNNFIGATNGGTLDLVRSSINQGSNGVIVSSGTNFFYSSSKVQLDSANITGGTLLSSNGGSLVVNSGTNSFVNLTNSAMVTITNGGTLNLTNTVNSASGVILGSGGNINGTSLTNNGIIETDQSISNKSLTLSISKIVNNNYIGVTNISYLDLNGASITQGTNGMIVANCGPACGSCAVLFDNSSVTGGTLFSANASSLVINSGMNSFANLTNNGFVVVNANSTLNMSNVTDAGAIRNQGTLNITSVKVDGGSLGDGTMTIGNIGSSTLTITNGGRVSDVTAVIGASNTSTGNFISVSSGSSWSNGNYIFVGRNGSGTVSLSGGIISDITAVVGQLTNSSGTVQVTGGTWSNSNYFFVGSHGNGTLTVSGGSISAQGITLASQSGSSGTLNIGRLGSNDSVAADTLLIPMITMGAGNASINFNEAGGYQLTSSITGNGTIRQQGSGTTILSGNDSGFKGQSIVSSGTLSIATNGQLGGSILLTNTGTYQKSYTSNTSVAGFGAYLSGTNVSFQLLAGSISNASTLSASLISQTNFKGTTTALNFHGTYANPITLSFTDLAFNASNNTIKWYDTNLVTPVWTNTIAGNTGNVIKNGYQGFNGSFNTFLLNNLSLSLTTLNASAASVIASDLLSIMGAYGYDSTTHTAWAVINHNSLFDPSATDLIDPTGIDTTEGTLIGSSSGLNSASVSAVPEPSTYALIGLSMLVLLIVAKRRGIATK